MSACCHHAVRRQQDACTCTGQLEQKPKRGKHKGKRGWVDEPVPRFKIRDEQGAGDGASGEAPATGAATVQMLMSMFGATLPQDVIQDVYRAKGPAAERCVETLLAMTAGAAESVGSPPARGGDDGASTSRAANNKGARCVKRAQGSDLWGMLPNDCRLLIVEKLEQRELAAIAMVSQSMAGFAARRRERVTVLRVRTSIEQVHLCIAAHTNAAAVRPWGL